MVSKRYYRDISLHLYTDIGLFIFAGLFSLGFYFIFFNKSKNNPIVFWSSLAFIAVFLFALIFTFVNHKRKVSISQEGDVKITGFDFLNSIPSNSYYIRIPRFTRAPFKILYYFNKSNIKEARLVSFQDLDREYNFDNNFYRGDSKCVLSGAQDAYAKKSLNIEIVMIEFKTPLNLSGKGYGSALFTPKDYKEQKLDKVYVFVEDSIALMNDLRN